MSERVEAIIRIIVSLISGFVLGIWKIVIQILVVVHWLIAVITDKRNKDIAEFSEIWNTQVYIFLRYVTFVSNKRPFPFNPLEKNMSKFKK